MLTITAPTSFTEGGIDFAQAPTPLADLLTDTMLIGQSLAPCINGSEAASFLDFLVRAGRLQAAIYLGWTWAENDEDARWAISDDGTALTIFNDPESIERVATITDPDGIAQNLPIRSSPPPQGVPMAPIPANTVYVYSFAPSTDKHAVGGHDWHPDRAKAEEAYVGGVKDSVFFGGSHKCRLLRVDVFADPHHDILGVTDELDARTDELEYTIPALRQYIPPQTTSDRLPTARRER